MKLSIGMIVVAIAIVVIVANASGQDEPTRATAGVSSSERLLRSDSQRLDSPADSDATFVEFLDFECEACRAAYPAIEELRRSYGDRMTFVVRYMPLHFNSEAASRAAEAAADQGKFEAMYHRLFETQPQWGEKRSSEEDVFFGLAENLGLDMKRFREVYDAQATIDRVARDRADGEALGVTGTPTFFLDGEKLEVSSFDELIEKVDSALAD